MVEADFEQHCFSEDPEHEKALRRTCALDLLANSADWKSSHCLLGPNGRIYAWNSSGTLTSGLAPGGRHRAPQCL